jgi:hypothetical protein
MEVIDRHQDRGASARRPAGSTDPGQRGAADRQGEGGAVAPTVRNVVEHARLMLTADLSYPVILGHDGRVMDGMHRIARALLDGVAEVSAARLPPQPEPDYRNIQPDQLTY